METNSSLSRVVIDDEVYFKISNSAAMRPFFMTIVSDSDHWMFISSNGGLTAGRKNAEYALFPYYTDDKITESADLTGSKSIFQVHKNGRQQIWEPFSNRCLDKYDICRNLYKSQYGDKVIFEEENRDLGLTFRYRWASSDSFGFVKRAELVNHHQEPIQVNVLDGLQNLMPFGVASALQHTSSNLVDAYKRSELEPSTGLGIFALSAIIVDKAEPSEALKANLAWSTGLSGVKYLLSSRQLDAFRAGATVQQETDVKGEKGAYFIQADLQLPAAASQEWMLIAEVNQNHAAVARLLKTIREGDNLSEAIATDVAKGTRQLVALNAAADGLQKTGDELVDARHFSNCLFNIMRGGIFDHHYQVEKADLMAFLAKANQQVYVRAEQQLAKLPATFPVQRLKQLAQETDDGHLKRLCLEYLPLKFSRRHGDPSRPWNRFSINIRNEEDGSKILDYEGNWRDIFQNWEALALAYPDFLEGMIHKFLNATTFDGYNPYRVTRDGFDWETIEPDDPWSYIGYWGDHQIIYLLKLLELLEQHQPGSLEQYFTDSHFVYANVPYKIKPYQEMVRTPRDTIDFDAAADQHIRARRQQMGADGALLTSADGAIYQVNFIEKLLATTLAKLANFIPTGGIWMNTQRPEWNDANNALVGNGVSMVTLYYLRRFLHFLQSILARAAQESFEVSKELATFYASVQATFTRFQHLLQGEIDGPQARAVLNELGQAVTDFRQKIYASSFAGEKVAISREDLLAFARLGLDYLEHTIAANQRPDQLYHAYNLVAFHEEDSLSIRRLSEMLEGQVAVLSAGLLSPKEALGLLDSLKQSALFRPDQYSYILYPNKNLPGFLQRNNIPAELVEQSDLLQTLLREQDSTVINQDVAGQYHFNGNFKNANDLTQALNQLEQGGHAALVRTERAEVLRIFEAVFNHQAFTGRSGTFFAYEGLGSIYWHMVSKLLLAVQENCLRAIRSGAPASITGRLLEHYYEISAGIGVHKSPELYGAFPTDAYSHTPAHKGAQQPGMTGQVKEDILSRFGELGVFVADGKLYFDPCLLRKAAFLQEAATFHYLQLDGQEQSIALQAGSLAFTYGQVPVVYQLDTTHRLEVTWQSGVVEAVDSWELDAKTSTALFQRTGQVAQITVFIQETYLK